MGKWIYLAFNALTLIFIFDAGYLALGGSDKPVGTTKVVCTVYERTPPRELFSVFFGPVPSVRHVEC